MALMLIDTGASVSILPRETYETIATCRRSPLVVSDIDIRAGNNSKVLCAGTSDIAFSIEGMPFTHCFYVCKDTTLIILGMDFLTQYSVEMNIAGKTMLLNGRSIRLFDYQGATVNCIDSI